MEKRNILLKAALLHDIGKICYRANSNRDHSSAGHEFMKSYFDNCTGEIKQFLDCILYHHAAKLKEASLSDNDLSYIVYEADNIAAGIDRRDNEEEMSGFDIEATLSSVFNIFAYDENISVGKYYLKGMNPDDKFNYPSQKNVKATASGYKDLLQVIDRNFRTKNPLSMDDNELLRIMEDTMSYVPSSTNRAEVCDISLFIHSKITGAIASCMYQYLENKNISNYKDVLLKKDFRDKQIYLLVSGDISGIQDFIYNIPSSSALKSLRGRSAYLEIMLENFIDELLTELNLSRANLLYAGGGHFYLLASADEETKSVIASIQESFNTWLLKIFSGRLYLAMGTAECSANELMHSNQQGNAFNFATREISCEKLNRYSETILQELFKSGSIYTKIKNPERECAVCHISGKELFPFSETGTFICPMCGSLIHFGEKILTHGSVFVISKTKKSDTDLEMFGFNKKLWMSVVKSGSLENLKDNIYRIYSKNDAVTGSFIATRLWMADYTSRNSEQKVYDFKELASMSCEMGRGINRIGVLRADVDNLGAAFMSGFVDTNSPEPMKYATFARYADLSRDMQMFFKLAVVKICEGSLDDFSNEVRHAFNIFGIKKAGKRNVHIVYSGGDDMFLVGAWDELLETIVDIRNAFQRFTGGKLTFSAGMALFSPSFPISRMADMTGILEDFAKKIPGKDGIALFGVGTEVDGAEALKCEHVYKWSSFIKGVCEEKINFLLEHLTFDESNKAKLFVGMTKFYKLFNLIEGMKSDRINLARFVYSLARMEPSINDANLKNKYASFSQKIYEWVRDDNDRQELLTAMTLLIYYLREDREA